jgi:hypothetical protein
MDSAELQRAVSKHSFKHTVKHLFIDAKWGWAATHAHRPTLGFACRIHANGDIRPHAQAPADFTHSLRFRERFHVDLADASR